MRLKIIVSSILLLFVITLVSAAMCGNGECEAGQYLEDMKIEDASTCYKDCPFTDYTICQIDKISGGICNFGGNQYNIKSISTIGCASEQLNDIIISFQGREREINGFSSQQYIQLHDNVDFSSSLQPCAAYITKATLYFKRTLNSQFLNDFVFPQKTDLNKKADNNIEIIYNFPIHMSNPYCKTKLTFAKTGEEITSSNVASCNINDQFIYNINNLEVGKYYLSSQYFDYNAENKIGEKLTTITITDCNLDNECSDGKFYTIDTCETQEDAKICQNKMNNALVYSLSGVFILILVVVVLILIKRK